MLQIRSGSFHKLRKMDELVLSNNRIRTLEPYSFEFLKLIRILDLSKNRCVRVRKVCVLVCVCVCRG